MSRWKRAVNWIDELFINFIAVIVLVIACIIYWFVKPRDK